MGGSSGTGYGWGGYDPYAQKKSTGGKGGYYYGEPSKQQTESVGGNPYEAPVSNPFANTGTTQPAPQPTPQPQPQPVTTGNDTGFSPGFQQGFTYPDYAPQDMMRSITPLIKASAMDASPYANYTQTQYSSPYQTVVATPTNPVGSTIDPNSAWGQKVASLIGGSSRDAGAPSRTENNPYLNNGTSGRNPYDTSQPVTNPTTPISGTNTPAPAPTNSNIPVGAPMPGASGWYQGANGLEYRPFRSEDNGGMTWDQYVNYYHSKEFSPQQLTGMLTGSSGYPGRVY